MPLLISTVVMFQAQNRETINSRLLEKLLYVSFKIIMTTSVQDAKTVFHKFTTQHQICKTKLKTTVQDQAIPIFWSQTGLVLRQLDHITDY